MARAFVAKMLPPGDSASGFFYDFEARPESGDSIYLNGLHEGRSGKEIMYFEFPMKAEAYGWPVEPFPIFKNFIFAFRINRMAARGQSIETSMLASLFQNFIAPGALPRSR